ncbi:hypothetical protein T492DRAFT_893605 [Pavlovales sp. CCMP2436]|nr:hypothetical protein T492DRAFT_893605 [Pavlovales sp. CCMP2436]
MEKRKKVPALTTEALIASPRGLSLLLEVRALLSQGDIKNSAVFFICPCSADGCPGHARLDGIGVHLDVLGGALKLAGSDANAPPPWPTLDDLPPELLAVVARALELSDELATSQACRKLREAAVAAEWQRDGREESTTLVCTALTSLRKLQWAASCGLPMDEVLCATLAAKGQLIELSWVRAHGCESIGTRGGAQASAAD